MLALFVSYIFGSQEICWSQHWHTELLHWTLWFWFCKNDNKERFMERFLANSTLCAHV